MKSTSTQESNTTESISIEIQTFACPYCNITIGVHKSEIACTIFRCGIYKANGQQIPPHAPKAECERLVAENLIIGCGGSFRWDGNIVSKCDYI